MDRRQAQSYGGESSAMEPAEAEAGRTPVVFSRKGGGKNFIEWKKLRARTSFSDWFGKKSHMKCGQKKLLLVWGTRKIPKPVASPGRLGTPVFLA